VRLIGGIPKLQILRSGNVGIGTSPSAKLDVAGTIKATEIKVEAQTADFVFEPDYKLRPLDEVEIFVKENKHLPEIPSAKQMEADGVNVAEMNKLLLQKVEELTLYSIQLKKDNLDLSEKQNRQEKQLGLQKEEIEKQKTKLNELKSLELRLQIIEKSLSVK